MACPPHNRSLFPAEAKRTPHRLSPYSWGQNITTDSSKTHILHIKHILLVVLTNTEEEDEFVPSARDESLVRWTGVIVFAMLVMLCLVLRPHPDNIPWREVHTVWAVDACVCVSTWCPRVCLHSQYKRYCLATQPPHLPGYDGILTLYCVQVVNIHTITPGNGSCFCHGHT